MNRFSKMLFVLGLNLFLLLPLAKADCQGDHCPMRGGMGGDMEKSPCPVVNQFFSDAHEMLEHKKDLGLTPEQIKTIKALKLEMKKHNIRQMADMQIMMLDVQSRLKEDKPDAEAINALVDKGSASMVASTKETVAAYVKLKGVLTEAQWEKMKEVH